MCSPLCMYFLQHKPPSIVFTVNLQFHKFHCYGYDRTIVHKGIFPGGNYPLWQGGVVPDPGNHLFYSDTMTRFNGYSAAARHDKL